MFFLAVQFSDNTFNWEPLHNTSAAEHGGGISWRIRRHAAYWSHWCQCYGAAVAKPVETKNYSQGTALFVSICLVLHIYLIITKPSFKRIAFTALDILNVLDGLTACQVEWQIQQPRAGSGVVRIDPLHFLAGCRKSRLNQALSVLSLSLGFF